MKILVVDDSPLDRELLRHVLEEGRHQVVEAVDGAEALSILRQEPVDAVISDVLMPNLDGYRLCLEVRRDERLRRLPFLIRTGTYLAPTDRALGQRVGADRYLLKSADGPEILAALGDAVEEAGRRAAPPALGPAEGDVIRQYSEVLVAKLEERNVELTRANEALVAGEERFRQLAENIREVFWLTDPINNILLYVSPAYELVWGRTAESLYQAPRTWLEAVHPEDQDRVRASLEAQRTKGACDQQYRIVRPDGSLRWIRDRAFPVRDATGRVYRVAGVAEDITERKQLEEAVREARQREVLAAAEARLQGERAERLRAEAQLGRFFDMQINLHCFAGFDGYFKRLNRVWEAVTGFTIEELMQVPYLDLVHPDDVAPTQREVAKLGRGALTVDYELRLRCRDGSYRWTRWSAAPLAEQGVILASGQDITARKEAERARQESESRLQAFLDHTTSLIFIKDTALRYVHVNRQFERCFGLASAQVLGRTDRELFPLPQARAFEANDRKVLEGGAPIQFEEAAHYQDGAHVSLVSKFPLRDVAGEIQAICGIATDITDRKQAEHDLRWIAGRLLQVQDSERRRLGHELHDSTAQSLAALEINLTALKKLTRGGADPRMRELVGDSLALASQSAREIRTMSYALRPPLLEEMGLAPALETHVRGFAERSRLQCRLLLPKDLGRLPVDVEVALFRIVQEALANAHRHSGTKRVTIRLRRTEGRFVLEVSDQGRGMPKAILENFLASKATVGVGLAGMRERARQLGGDLTIRSSARGTTVRAELPAQILQS